MSLDTRRSQVRSQLSYNFLINFHIGLWNGQGTHFTIDKYIHLEVKPLILELMAVGIFIFQNYLFSSSLNGQPFIPPPNNGTAIKNKFCGFPKNTLYFGNRDGDNNLD